MFGLFWAKAIIGLLKATAAQAKPTEAKEARFNFIF